MSEFEFVFSLFGLLLGLALAEALGGLARALKSRHHVNIGWATALLGTLVSCDVVTFWMYGWLMRDVTHVTWPVMFGGFVVTALYYLAASLIFPSKDEEWADLDGHFDRHYRKVIGAVLAVNIVLVIAASFLVRPPSMPTALTLVTVWSFFPATLLALMTRSRRVVIACLIWLIALYPLSTLAA